MGGLFAGFYQGILYSWLSNMRGTLLEMLRIIVYWGLYWGSPSFGKLRHNPRKISSMMEKRMKKEHRA